jgi:hypothetical protein
MYMQMTQKPKLEPVAPIFELGRPSQAGPLGRTVKASITALASEKGGWQKSVYCEHGDRMDQFALPPAICPVAQVGPYLMEQHTRKSHKP